MTEVSKSQSIFLLQWDKKGLSKYGISVVCLHRLENQATIGKYVEIFVW